MHLIVCDENQKGKRPAVLVVHEWWGLTDYPVMRARKLAELGYIAMAVDMYGDGKIATNPMEAQELATPFYTDPQFRLDSIGAEYKFIVYPMRHTHLPILMRQKLESSLICPLNTMKRLTRTPGMI